MNVGVVSEFVNPSIQFNTEEVKSEDSLNGIEFKATTQLLPRSVRQWYERWSPEWTEWTSGGSLGPAHIVKKNGKWSVVTAIPNQYKALDCSKVPKG